MAVEATAANLAADGASAGVGALTATGAAVKAFILANPATIAGVVGIAIGLVAYRAWANRGHEHEEGCEHSHEDHAKAAEPSAA